MGDVPKVIKVVRTSVACPSQWEATTEDGQSIYVRYRYGGLSVRMGATIHAAIGGEQYLTEKQLGHELDGDMTGEELVRHTDGVVEWIEKPE